MKEETKQLLFVKGQAKLAEFLSNVIEKDGNTALEDAIIASKKSIDDCWKYITYKARKFAVEGCACVDNETVFQWAMKFYAMNGEPDDMEKPAPKPAASVPVEKPKKRKPEEPVEPVAETKKESESIAVEETLFDSAQLTMDEVLSENVQPAEPAPKPAPAEITADVLKEVPGEELNCVICGRKMKDAYAGRDIESIRKWTKGWTEKYGAVFCCKEHMEQYVKEHGEVKQ